VSTQRPMNFLLDVPVLFHVIYDPDGNLGFVTEARMREQVARPFKSVLCSLTCAVLSLIYPNLIWKIF